MESATDSTTKESPDYSPGKHLQQQLLSVKAGRAGKLPALNTCQISTLPPRPPAYFR
jgi:hypothetical protein